MFCYVKSRKYFFAALIFLSVAACRRRGNEPAVIEDLGIALQTIKHQIEDTFSVKSSSSRKTIVESNDRKTEVEALKLEFAQNSNCEIKTGVMNMSVTFKAAGKVETYRAEFIDKTHVKLKNLTTGAEANVYTLDTLCAK